MSFRSWGTAVLAAAMVMLIGTAVPAHAAPTPSVTDSAGVTRYLNTVIVPGVPTFGAISGIDRIGRGDYAMVSTDVGRAGPARTYTVNFPVDAASQIAAVPSFTGVGTILGPGNLPILPGRAQFEGIRGFGANYVVASGGNTPFVRIVGRAGNFVRDLPLPRSYRSTKTSGLAGQRGLTGVAVSPQGYISVITAGGLRQDVGNAARLLTFAKGGNRELVYKTDPGKVAADVLAVNDTDFLVLERGQGRVTRIYWTTSRGAESVTGKQKLSGKERAMPKKVIFDVAPLPYLATGNISGMSWGPWLPEQKGKKYRSRSLLLVTNNAFAGPTRLHGLEYRFPKP